MQVRFSPSLRYQFCIITSQAPHYPSSLFSLGYDQENAYQRERLRKIHKQTMHEFSCGCAYVFTIIFTGKQDNLDTQLEIL
jgi:hypothetical protein